MIDFAPSAGLGGGLAPGHGTAEPSLRDGRARRRDLERLGDRIARLSAHIHAATWRLLRLIREFDEREGWHEEGFRSCAAWLSWRTGIAPGAAREKVRVARALAGLPRLSEALRTGRLSYSAARALTRVATPENEAELVEVARRTTAAQLERLVRGWLAADRAEDLERERERHARRELWVLPEPDGSWTIRGRLDPEVGAVLRRALEAAAGALYAREAADREAAAEARRADALGLVAEAALGRGLGARAVDGAQSGPAAAPSSADPASTDPRPTRPAVAKPERAPVVGRADRFQVVVHVSAETLAVDSGGPGESRIEGGPHVSAETSRRIACDAARVAMTHDRAGNVLNVGRRTRTVPPALRRALDHRDGGCRFPGCTARWCDAHHLRHWADGGETKLETLVLLCRRHHRRVHEDGWRVERSGGGGVRFHRPDGRLLPEVPAPASLEEDPVAALEREQAGLGIDPWTPTPRWLGDRLDVDWALFTLRRPAWPHPRPARPDVSAETSVVPRDDGPDWSHGPG